MEALEARSSLLATLIVAATFIILSPWNTHLPAKMSTDSDLPMVFNDMVLVSDLPYVENSLLIERLTEKQVVLQMSYFYFVFNKKTYDDTASFVRRCKRAYNELCEDENKVYISIMDEDQSTTPIAHYIVNDYDFDNFYTLIKQAMDVAFESIARSKIHRETLEALISKTV